MPELPEVESIRRELAPCLIGAQLCSAHLRRPDILRFNDADPSRDTPRQRENRIASALLECMTVIELRRHGKQLAIIARPSSSTAEPRALIVQLGMSGQLRYVNNKTPQAQPDHVSIDNFTHVHATWQVIPPNPSTHAAKSKRPSAGPVTGTLFFRDPRRFGGLRAIPSLAALNDHWATLGPDALDTHADHLITTLRSTRRAIKAALLDQSILAGVGNIYADEALFLSGIAPLTPAATISPKDLALLADAIRRVLSSAISAGGSTLRDYRSASGAEGTFQSQHAVYGRGGEPCTQCGTPLVSQIVSQRTTTWCPQCQSISVKIRKHRST